MAAVMILLTLMPIRIWEKLQLVEPVLTERQLGGVVFCIDKFMLLT